MEKTISPQRARNIHYIDFSPNIVNDTALIQEMRNNIINNDGYIVRNVVDPKILERIKEYLILVGRGSLPSYHHLKQGCPDFHRIHQFDQRSYVKGLMHQFMFHPWNQNMFDLFSLMKPIYQIKNLISNLDKDAYLTTTPDDGFISRLSFQYYPQGGGCIKRHSDPVDVHQLCVPILSMSDYGKDYQEGGGYVVDRNDQVVNLDSHMKKGDVVFFNAQVVHGVAPVDPEKAMDWFSFAGRWICLVSVIKTEANQTALNALQLED